VAGYTLFGYLKNPGGWTVKKNGKQLIPYPEDSKKPSRKQHISEDGT
jgi:hypothetical protein